MTNYYVKNGGSDSNTGLSDAQAWETIAKVESFSFSTGNNVYFLCGGTWTDESLTIDWAGILGDRVVIGAYYMDGGSETLGVNGDGKPIIQGHLISATNKFPANQNYNLIEARGGQDYITVQDLKVKDSGGSGIGFLAGSDYCTVQRCDIDGTYIHGIMFSGNSGAIVEYNDVYDTNYQYLWAGNWGAAIWGPFATCRYNTVRGAYGEGISPRGSGSIVMNNLVYDTRSVGIYVDGRSNNEIAYNLILGTDDIIYEKYPGWHNSGIKIAVEPSEKNSSENNRIHHNIIINTFAGIHVHNQSTLPGTYKIQNNHFYNNTLIDNKYNLFLSTNVDLVNYYKNNLHYKNDAASHNILITTAGGINNWVADYNHWDAVYTAGQDTGMQSSNDQTGDAKIAQVAWRNWSGLNNLTFIADDLAIGSGSPVIDNGIDLGNDYDESWCPNALLPPNAVSMCDQDDYGSGWEIGAYVYQDAIPFTRSRGILRQKPRYNVPGGRF
jgi:parallel beta-helix repeat protein